MKPIKLFFIFLYFFILLVSNVSAFNCQDTNLNYDECIALNQTDENLIAGLIYLNTSFPNHDFIKAYNNKIVVDNAPFNTTILLGGDPGTGKTQLTKFIGKVIDKYIQRVICEPDKEVSDFLGHEVLTAVGDDSSRATATTFKKGDLVKPMESGDIVYLDEFNKLRHGVQKGLNSILEEKSVYRLEGVEHPANKETMYMMSYNPGTGTDFEDIEPAVFDRCEYIKFNDQPKDFQVRVAMVKAGLLKPEEIIDEDMEERAIEEIEKKGEKSYRFLVRGQDGAWYEYGNGDTEKNKIEPEGKVHTYYFYKGVGDQKLTTNNKRAKKYYHIISNLADFVHDVKGIIREGSEYLSEDFRNQFDIARFSKLEGHMPSFRLVINNVQKYIQYSERHNADPDIVLEQIAYDVINTVCAKIPSDQTVGRNMYPKDMLKLVASARKLLRSKEYADIPNVTNEYHEEQEE